MLKLLNWLEGHILLPAEQTMFNFHPNEGSTPKLYRRRLFPRNNYFNVYLHHYIDADRVNSVHDHPFYFLALTLAGAGQETLWKLNRKQEKGFHSLKFIRPLKPFRFRFYSGSRYCHYISKVSPNGLWTLVFHGPRYKEFNFYTKEVTDSNSDIFVK